MLEQIEAPATSNVNRFHMCFALGAAYEARRDFARSFAFYEQGNLLKKKDVRYDPDLQDRALQRQMEFCTPELFEDKAGMGGAYADPIFIVGLPRAGSTLLEQILARYPKILTELSAEKLQRFADAFIEDTRFHRKGAPYFIDKMPNNFQHVGLIHLILPNAKVIDARRHPMACCFSGFKQLFADGQEFTYGQEEIARYYRGYVALMEHWDRVLPGKVLRVHYEHLVADLESQVRRILDFLGLPFEEGCLRFYRTDRSERARALAQLRALARCAEEGTGRRDRPLSRRPAGGIRPGKQAAGSRAHTFRGAVETPPGRLWRTKGLTGYCESAARATGTRRPPSAHSTPWSPRTGPPAPANAARERPAAGRPRSPGTPR
jgi:hypothetical protein